MGPKTSKWTTQNGLPKMDYQMDYPKWTTLNGLPKMGYPEKKYIQNQKVQNE